MTSFRILLYKPLIDIVRWRGTSSKPNINKWKNPNILRLSNPGIQKRLKILEHEDRIVTDPSDIDDSEFDFMEVDKMHDVHESEEDETKHMKQMKIVGNKYFKPEKELNLLTWSEKEQIHYLHSSDDTWTIEKLAQSFPASETTIKKILKSKWRPRDARRVLKHDLAVQKNWDLLQSGKLERAPELKAHLSQFTRRNISVSQIPDTAGIFEEADSIPKPKWSEFGSIIESYKSLKCKDTPKEDVKDHDIFQKGCDTSTVPKSDSFLLHGGELYQKRGRHVTLEKYRERVKKAIERGRNASLDTKLMVSQQSKCEDVPETDKDANSEINIIVKDHAAREDNSVAAQNPDLSRDPPHRIRVPPDKWKKGCTFKVGDSYYDDDGTFLYRVPGMK